MPSGAKKKKAAKRKNPKMAVNIPIDNRQQGLPPSPNPSSDFLSPMIESRGNGHERRRSTINDEFEETFETPRFQPETPRFPLETPYYSMENRNLRNSRGEVNVLLGESSKSLDVEVPLKEQNFEMKEEESGVIAENPDDSHEEIPSEEGEGPKDGDGLKATKLDEKEEESPLKEEEVMWENSEVEDVRSNEKSVPVDEERTPNVSIEKVDVSSSNEKEVKVVPWPDLEIPAGNGVVNVDVEVICSEKEGDGVGNKNLERELNLVDENKQPVPLDDVVESVQGMLPQIDAELTNNKFDASVEKISVSALITEEAGHGSKAPPVNSESLVGIHDAEPSLHAEKTGIEQRNKVACCPGLVRHAKVWNCCGLLDVFTSSDR